MTPPGLIMQKIEMSNAGRLQHFPISFFAIVMGMAGLTIAWEKAVSALGIIVRVGPILVSVTAATFLIILTLYTAKLLRYRDAVSQELHHPVKINFFPTISISLLLLAIASLPYSTPVAHGLWLAGTTVHLLFTFYVMNTWIHHEHFEIHHINPAWFIPVVGNVIVPVAGVPLGYNETSWFFFSIGIVFWLVLLTIIFYRVLFHQPIQARLMPTFFILIAPPAVGFISYMRLVGDLDTFARILYFVGLFLTLLLITQINRFARLQFFLSWWAYSFPVAAITIASMVMYTLTAHPGYRFLSTALLALLSLIVVYLSARTTVAVLRKDVCVEE